MPVGVSWIRGRWLRANLRDGRVELVALGDPTELDRFLGAIHLEMSGYISDTDVQTEPADGEPLSGFSIRP